MDLIKYIYESIRPENESEYNESIMYNEMLYNNLKQDGIYICRGISDTNKQHLSDYIEIGGYYIIRKNNREIAWLNSKNEFEWDFTSLPIYRRLLPPPIETVNHTYIISCLIKEVLKTKEAINYLEFGIRWGNNFKTICELNKKGFNYGVDLDLSNFNKHINSDLTNYKLYEIKTSEYKNNGQNMDIVFIDADHNCESVYNDFTNVIEYMNKDGYIILHDTYPCSPEYLDKNGSYDCYKSPLYIKNSEWYKNKKITILTLPLNPGITIIHIL